MIKRLSILICLLISCAFAYVETPILVNTGALNVETVENAKMIITKPVSVLDIHKIAGRISSEDGEFFCAGIKR